MSEKTTIQIDKDVKNILDSMGFRNESMNDIIKRLIEKRNTETMNTAIVDKYGKASISRTLVGKTIEWRVKE